MPSVRLILPICLFLSGYCALAYQVAWARYLSTFLGATAPAYTIVLATFMGGLAGGAWLFGRLADRTPRPLRLYGRIEVGVGLFCLLFPWIMDLLGPLYLWMAAPLFEVPIARGLARVALAVTVLAIPSILMGGTLPAASRFFVRALDDVGAGVGRLYYVNALGAVMGALLAGFVMIPWFGLHATFWIAAAVNVSIGLRALRVSTRIDGASACPAPGWEAALEELEDRGPSESPFPIWVALVALVATAASGAASMIHEVSWIRLLSLVLGGSTHAFTIMVAAFILGIAIGSWLVSWWRPLAKGGLAAFGWLEVGVAFVVMAMVPIYNRLSYFYLEIGSAVPRTESHHPLYLFVGFALCVAVMMIPTVLLGATFPLAARLSTRSVAALGGGVGRAYAFNTGGTILGTVIAAHLLFPLLGLFGTFAFAAALNLSAGMCCLAGAVLDGRENRDRAEGRAAGRRLLPAAGIVGVGVAFVALVGLGPRMDEAVLSRGVYRSNISGFQSYQEFRAWLLGGIDLVHYADGPEGSVSVLDIKGQRVLNVNGKPEASSQGDMPTQLCIAHLPLMLHPSPERALLVGLGGGATAGALLTHTDTRTTAVELSPEVVAANRYFASYNRNAVDDPRLDLVIEDAKAYLGLTRERFDIIISQPSNPWVAGNASLFTSEFFRLVASRLAPGGMMVQWFHDYEMTDDAVRTILRTFSESFPSTRLFHCGDGRDYILVGTREPLEPDLERMSHVIATNVEAREDLERYLGIRTPLGVLVRNVLDDHGVRGLAEGGLLHTDRRPVLDYLAPKGVFLGAMSPLVVGADQRWDPPVDNDLLYHRVTGGRPLQGDDAFAEAADAAMDPFDNLRRGILEQWVAATGSPEAMMRLAVEQTWAGLDDEALEALRTLDASGRAQDDAVLHRWNLEALAAYREGDDEGVDRALGEMRSKAEETLSAAHYELLADMAELLERHGTAKLAWRAALGLTEDEAKWDMLDRLVGLARASRQAGDVEAARAALEQARSIRADYWPLIREGERLESL